MNNSAKRFVSAAPVIWLILMSPSVVHAQSYPHQDIHFVCAFPAGSGADVLVRLFAEKVRFHSQTARSSLKTRLAMLA